MEFKEHIQKAFAVQHASFHMEQIMGEKLLIDYVIGKYKYTEIGRWEWFFANFDALSS